MPVLRRRPAGAALVEQQHPVAPQRPVQPAGCVAAGARRAPTRTALQEQQVRLVGAGEVGGAQTSRAYTSIARRPGPADRAAPPPSGRPSTHPAAPAPPLRTTAPLAAPPPSATSPPLHLSGDGERRHQRGEQQHREQLERQRASRRRRPARAAGPGPGSDRVSRRRRRRRGRACRRPEPRPRQPGHGGHEPAAGRSVEVRPHADRRPGQHEGEEHEDDDSADVDEQLDQGDDLRAQRRGTRRRARPARRRATGRRAPRAGSSRPAPRPRPTAARTPRRPPRLTSRRLAPGRAGRGRRRPAAGAGRLACDASFGSGAPASGAGGGGTPSAQPASRSFSCSRSRMSSSEYSNSGTPEQGVERADLDADPAVHAQREVDARSGRGRCAGVHGHPRRRAASPCGSRCRCTSRDTPARRACRRCSSPRPGRSPRGCGAGAGAGRPGTPAWWQAGATSGPSRRGRAPSPTPPAAGPGRWGGCPLAGSVASTARILPCRPDSARTSALLQHGGGQPVGGSPNRSSIQARTSAS